MNKGIAAETDFLWRVKSASVVPLTWWPAGNFERWQKSVLEAEFLEDDEVGMNVNLSEYQEAEAYDNMWRKSKIFDGMTENDGYSAYRTLEIWINRYVPSSPFFHLVRMLSLLPGHSTIRFGGLLLGMQCLCW